MKYWTWLHPKATENPEDWKRHFDRFRASGIDAILPCLYSGGEVLYSSGHLSTTAPILEQMLPLVSNSTCA